MEYYLKTTKKVPISYLNEEILNLFVGQHFSIICTDVFSHKVICNLKET